MPRTNRSRSGGSPRSSRCIATTRSPAGTGGPGGLLGAQANLWTEHLDSARRLHYAAFPRLCAFAENLWSPLEAHDYPDFVRRLESAHLGRLAALGVDHRPLAGPRPWQRRPGVAGTLRLPAG